MGLTQWLRHFTSSQTACNRHYSAEYSWLHSEARNRTQQHTDSTKRSVPGWKRTYKLQCISLRVVESESGESHVFSWSQSRESVFKTAGVGVGFLKLLESESGVGVGFSKLLESESGVGTFVAITNSNVY